MKMGPMRDYEVTMTVVVHVLDISEEYAIQTARSGLPVSYRHLPFSTNVKGDV